MTTPLILVLLPRLPTNERDYSKVNDVLVDGNQDPYDSCVLPNVYPKSLFLAIETLKSYLFIPNIVCILKKNK